ncbi:HAD hydrolase-like protein [Kamptonema sp. UHCC 0994]|uniref:HAD hydrolase-like protein n=1 Tax=Kamptonema sp. UHCC 0994 TaxID=3031329 RepID=UPI0023BA916A|nr:HAD hydrolase-like protein [Kamptonema sp. UHCC 0994]MDF0556372.1 HAD hydrolase-like protein [Kamptonema sp. UHCC 0994]
MTKFFFFDLDGTLRQPKSGAKFINKPDDQEPISGAQEAVKYYSDRGFICIGITNQGGVAAGHKSLESAIEEQRITLQLFPELSEIFFCPNYEGDICWQLSHDNVPLEFSNPVSGDGSTISCRKPGHGMIAIASSNFCSPEELQRDCWMVGDRPEDQQCATSAGINFIWADYLHAKFQEPGMIEIDPTHLEQTDEGTLKLFLSL